MVATRRCRVVARYEAVKHRSRLERAEQLGIAGVALAAGQPLRQVAAGLGVARSTLRDWRAAVPLDGMPPEVAAGLSTPAGARWLHRLVVAMHLVVTLRAGAGVRLVCELLTLSGLSAVVGASYGSQYAVNVQVQEALLGQAQELRAALAVDMPPREVAVCEDETFHPEICLVAIEPVSNFILLEQYAADRTAATWTQALERALTGLPVTVVQGTSDEAKALRRHIEKDRGAQHVSDLFHGQHEVSKGTSLHLARRVREASATVAAAAAHLKAQRAAERDYDAQSPRPQGRPPAFAARIEAALSDLVQAEAQETEARTHQSEARASIRELGTLFHPYDLEHGRVQPVAQVVARFAEVWARLARLAKAADLPTRGREHLAKAQRLTVQWLASLTFFFATVQSQQVTDTALADRVSARHQFLGQMRGALARPAQRRLRIATRCRLDQGIKVAQQRRVFGRQLLAATTLGANPARTSRQRRDARCRRRQFAQSGIDGGTRQPNRPRYRADTPLPEGALSAPP